MQKLIMLFLCLLCFNCGDKSPLNHKEPVYSGKDLAFVSELIEINEFASSTLEIDIIENMVELKENGESIYRITELNLFQSNISVIPKSIANLDSLVTLNIEQNFLEQLPDTICSLTRLQESFTNNNNLCVPADYPSCMYSQIDIYLQNCASYPDENDQEFIDELIIMNNIDDSTAAIVQNNIVWETIVEQSGLIDRITELDLAFLEIDTLPFSIGGLEYLRWLELENNQLTAIPESFGALDSLSYLGLYNNEILNLPYSMGQLTDLEVLKLYNNQLNFLEFDFSEMTKLEILWISNNNISSINSSICSIYENLDEFFFSQNQLCTNIPFCLENVINPDEQDCDD